MTAAFRLFGAETSAFSTKLRSYMRYKQLDHEWIARTAETEDAFRQSARFATLPVLVTAGGHAVHDSTLTIGALESDSPAPEIVPEDKTLAFFAVLLEDYADLWLSKAVIQYRWGRRKDQKDAAARALVEYYGEAIPDNRKELEKQSVERMTEGMPLMGLDKDMGGVVEKSFKRFIKLLNTHLEKHLYIFGGRPSLADFGIAAQISQMLKDPTPCKIIEKEAPFVKAWCEFMQDPKPGGPFETLDDVVDTLKPLFRKELVVAFLPWAAANLEAVMAREETLTVTLGKDEITHAPLKSAARSFKETRRQFSYADDTPGLVELLDELEAAQWLRRPERPAKSGDSEDGERPGRRRRGRKSRRKGADANAQEPASEAAVDAAPENETEAEPVVDAPVVETGADVVAEAEVVAVEVEATNTDVDTKDAT